MSRSAAAEESLYRRIVWRLCPLLFVAYLIACVDRTNIGFAKLQMQSELGMTDTIYGFGAGIFFIGYFLFELPSNLLLQRYGARKWIARIMASWGVISMLMCMAHTPTTFYVLRFLLGVAEAGLVPGVIFYLTGWFPRTRRSRLIAVFYSASAFAGMLGGPLSGYLMDRLNGSSGFGGWQWMFVLEGIPSVLIAVVVFFFLDDSPQTVNWLDAREKALVLSRLDPDSPESDVTTVGGTLRSGRMWWLTFIYFTQASGYVGMTMWLPSIIHSSGVKTITETGLLSAIPYLCAIVTMYLVSRSADRRAEYRWHVIVPQVAAAIALLIGSFHADNTVVALACLSVAIAGVISSTPPFWALPSEFLRGTGAAAGIAVVSATGNLGGFVSPFLIGSVRDLTGSMASALWVVAGLLVAGAVGVALLPKELRRAPGAARMDGATEPNYP